MKATSEKFSLSLSAAGLLIPLAFLLWPTSSEAAFQTAQRTAAQNANSETLVVEKDEYSFVADSQTITSWQGTFKRRRTSTIVNQKLPLQTLVAYYYLGEKAKSTVSIQTYRFDPETIYRWVKSKASTIESEAHDPELTIFDGRAVSFTPPTPGVSIDSYSTTFNIIASLESGLSTAELAVSTTEPRTPLKALNSLGITELIARGESKFNGSPKNRRTNIAVGVDKIKGVIIKPGEEFSFNKYLGPVEKEYGFVPELVIKKTGTVPELGGGLCQVSSTTWRAAMQAGLPITQRKNHSYAVQYYAPQGTDATIYPGVIDLKFINDTPGAILIWPYLKDKDTLIFDFYGTKDDREVVLEKPIQYDRKSDGSMKASWTRHVTKNGVTTTNEFKSVYLPPALFHKEETFVAATPPPTPTTEAPAAVPDLNQQNETQKPADSTTDPID
jgi:vancomycin resistance protein YoaR